MADDPDKIDITAETPIGKLAAKGVRVSDLIGLLTLVAVAGAGAVLYRHAANGSERDAALVITMKEISSSLALLSPNGVAVGFLRRFARRRLVAGVSLRNQTRGDKN